MRALIQRVTSAKVEVDNRIVGEIDAGLLVFLAIEKHDTQMLVARMAEKLLNYRVFGDDDGKMNLNVQQVNGGLLVVSQFTLAADTRKGNRPSFTTAAPPELGQQLYEAVVAALRAQTALVETGAFGANMQISLLNDGPVTFLLEVN